MEEILRIDLSIERINDAEGSKYWVFDGEDCEGIFTSITQAQARVTELMAFRLDNLLLEVDRSL